MDKRLKYFLKRKPTKCPNCGEKKVATILYGLPSSEMDVDARAGRIVLGGCCLTECDPSWECTGCGTQIYHEELRDRFLENQMPF
jgi:hypothetical protein